jgi:hypothetical protein
MKQISREKADTELVDKSGVEVKGGIEKISNFSEKQVQ